MTVDIDVNLGRNRVDREEYIHLKTTEDGLIEIQVSVVFWDPEGVAPPGDRNAATLLHIPPNQARMLANYLSALADSSDPVEFRWGPA